MESKRWQDWLQLFFGLFLFVGPWILGFSDESSAAWNAYFFGLAIMLLATMAVVSRKAREPWADVSLGVWLLVSPWALGFSALAVPAGITMAVGAMVTALGVWALALDMGFEKWWHDRHPTT